MTKHTPGPWHQPVASRTILGKGDNGRFTICVMQNPHIDAQEANARLIAAAPELLAVLQKVQHFWDTGGDAKSRYAHEVRAAIAKATGDA